MLNFRHIVILCLFFTLTYLSITGCNDDNIVIPEKKDTTVVDTTHKDTNSQDTTTYTPVFYYKQPLRPFPYHTNYTDAVIKPQTAQNEMDAKVISFYRAWRSRYLKAFNDSMYYVHYTREYHVGNAISCSEGHGFGMVITALMAGVDTTSYDDFIKLYKWYDNHRSRINNNLMAWQQNKWGGNSNGADSATDGDLDIAYALLLAHYQWGSDGEVDFLEEAKKIIEGIYQSDISAKYKVTELGDWATSGRHARGTRFCDFMLDHMRAFKIATGDNKWDEIIDTSYSVINTVANSATGLLPDFAIYNLDDNKFEPATPNFLESENDGDYYYNSCRSPWRIATDYIVYGDTGALAVLTRLNRWIIQKTDNKPSKIRAGYKLDGTQLYGYDDMAFTAPFGVCAMVDPQNQEWLDAMWNRIINKSISSEQYFGNSIKMLSIITMSGNWWKPE